MKVKITTKQASTSAALSHAQKEYRKFFRKHLEEHGGVDALKDPESAAEVFNTISDKWEAFKKENGIQTKN